MSIMGFFLAFASGLAAKVKIPRDPIKDEVERLRRRVWKLEHDLCAAEIARDAFEAQLERHRAEAALDQRWREHVAHAAMAQQQAMQAQQRNAVQPDWAFYQQQRALPKEWDGCTCVPDRASAFNRPPG
jgi:hypothetical protein